jgi:hypothetical protein
LKLANKPRDRAIGINSDYDPPVQGEKSSYRPYETNEIFNIGAVDKLDTGYNPFEKPGSENEWICAFGRHTPKADAAIFRMR